MTYFNTVTRLIAYDHESPSPWRRRDGEEATMIMMMTPRDFGAPYKCLGAHQVSIRRACLYWLQVESDGLDHCFDCASEVYILRQYLDR
jgi:hypothetical protein